MQVFTIRRPRPRNISDEKSGAFPFMYVQLIRKETELYTDVLKPTDGSGDLPPVSMYVDEGIASESSICGFRLTCDRRTPFGFVLDFNKISE